MPYVDKSDRVSKAVPPPHRPCGHLLPRGEKGAGVHRARDIQNRRKWCALNYDSAHNLSLGVRVGALTNKAAHYLFHLVRTGLGTVRRLTSISGAATGGICRERRGSVTDGSRGVRKLARLAHIAERTEGVPDSKMLEPRTRMRVPSMLRAVKMSAEYGRGPIFWAGRPSVVGGAFLSFCPRLV